MRGSLGYADEVAVGDVENSVTKDHGKCAFHYVETFIFLPVDMGRRTVAREGLYFGNRIGPACLLGSCLDGVEVAHEPEAAPLSCFKDSAIRVVQYFFAHLFLSEGFVSHIVARLGTCPYMNFSPSADDRRYHAIRPRSHSCRVASLPDDTSTLRLMYHLPCDADRHA